MQPLDISESLKIIRQKKLFIGITAVIVCVTSSMISLLTYKETYNSTIRLETAIDVSWMERPGPNTQFKRLFLQRNLFNGWKKLNPSSVISFDELSPTVNVDGYELISQDKHPIRFKTSSEGILLLADTQSLAILEDLRSYALYVNAELTDRYSRVAKTMAENYSSILERFDYNHGDRYIVNLVILERILKLQTLISEGAEVYWVSAPTQPILLRPYPWRLFVVSSLVAGLCLGTLIALVAPLKYTGAK